jgi:hypothetical protein
MSAARPKRPRYDNVAPSRADFQHSNVNGVVSYLGSPLIISTRQGWYVLQGHPDLVVRAAKAAVWSLPDAARAEDLRRETVGRLFDE